MRAIIYCRVSSDTQGHGRSVAEQEAECREVCERNNWHVAEVLIDNDIGASRWSGKERPAYKEAKQVLRPGDVLVTWEASRAQRDLKAYVQLRDLCTERGVLWSYSGRLYDLSKGEDRFTTGLDALLAEREADDIRNRVLRAQRANAAEGKAHGRIPYGYIPMRDQRTGKIVKRIPSASEAATIVEASDRVLAGQSLYSIAKDFNEREIPPPGKYKEWRGFALKSILTSPTYAGIRVHKDARIPGDWEAIISLDKHQKIVAILTSENRVQHRGVEPRYLLSGIAKCGVCGEPMWRLKSTSNRGKDVYTCTANRCTSRMLEPVDALVTEVILRWAESKSGPNEITDPVIVETLAKARELQARLDTFVEKAAEGTISVEMLGRMEQKLAPQIRQLERRAQNVPQPQVLELLGPNARTHWDRMDVVARRTVVRSLLSVTILKAKRGRVFSPESIRVQWVHSS